MYATLAIIILIAVFYFSMRYVHYREKKKRILEKKILNLELLNWQSKINPHFLFNTLNSLSSLVKLNQTEQALEYINAFSVVLRTTIQDSRKLLIKVSDEINYITQLLKLEKLKREGNLEFEITYNTEEVLNYYIPSLVVQPTVENSLKHGIKHNKEGKIFIQFELANDKVICSASDNGHCMKNYDKPVYQEQGYKSMGMILIDKKIKIIEKALDIKITFNYEHADKVNRIGVKTTFYMPLIKNYNIDDKSYNS